MLEEALSKLRLVVDNSKPPPIATVVQRICTDPNVHAPHGVWLSEAPPFASFVRRLSNAMPVATTITYYYDTVMGHHWLFFPDCISTAILRRMLSAMGYATELQTTPRNFVPRGVRELEELVH